MAGISRRALFSVLTAIGASFAPKWVDDASADETAVIGIIYDAASRWGVSGDTLVALARCESNLNPDAVSERLNVNGTPDMGLFQINAVTWEWWLGLRGMAWDDASAWNAWDNAEMAAWAIANGYLCHWSCAAILGWC